MKNLRLLLALTLFLGFNFNSIESHAQFGKLNKLKSKVKTTKKNNKTNEDAKKGFSSFNNSEKLIESLEKWEEKKYSYEYACRTIRELDTTLRYKDYMAFRLKTEKEYPKDFKSEDVQKEFKIIDDYFNVEVYNHVNQDMSKHADKQIKMMYAEHGKYQDYQFSPEGYLRELKELAEYLSYYKRNLIGDVSKISATETKIVNEKNKLEKYINGGEYEAFKIKAKQERVDRVRFAKKAMNTTKYDAMISKTVDNGKAIRIVIVSSQWQIVKNSYGIPEKKWLGVDLAVKRGGKCYLRYGRLTKTHEGGGTYGKTYFLYHDNGPKEMNCKNVFK